MPRARGGARCLACGKETLRGEYCGNHQRECADPGCTRRIRAASEVCYEHRDFGRIACHAAKCSRLAARGSEYCGNHRYVCRTAGCAGRTREGGHCTECWLKHKQCDRVRDGERLGRRAGGPISTGRQLEQLIEGYEQIQDETSMRGAIARDRLPILRRELGLLQGATK